MKKDVVIVGGGCIGLMSAYCLQKSGRSVTVIDKSDITNAKFYYDYFGTELNEKNVLNTYSGKKITDKSKISKLFNTSSIYSKCDENDYLVLFKFKNGIYLTKCMSENDAKQFVK